MRILAYRIMAESRKRRLSKMTDDELERLNIALSGKGHNWATAERIEVCRELGKRMADSFKEHGTTDNTF